MEKEYDYSALYDVNAQIDTYVNDISVEKSKHIKTAIEELAAWCDLFIERRNKEKEKTQYLNSLNDKVIVNIAQPHKTKLNFFKNKEEVKKMIFHNWFAFLLRHRLPKYCDGKTFRRKRRELFNELQSGKLVTNGSANALIKCFQKLKDL